MKAAFKGFAGSIKKPGKGYTIIEVMLVLAVSTSLLFSAIVVFRGQQNATAFTQAVQDLNSKLINYADQVKAGTFPESTDYNCDGSGPTIQVSATGGELGGRQGCVFMGRAIQFQKDKETMYVYTVLGKMIQPDGSPVTDITQAAPEPAIRTDGSCDQTQPTCWVMSDTYTLNGGTKITKSWVDTQPSTDDWYMGGIYTNLDPGGSITANTQLNLRGYHLDKAAASYGFSSGGVKDCIEESAGCLPRQVSKWYICVSSADGSHTFLLTVRSTTNGLATELTDNGC
jgi:type II secretory pathway pseudopilin PulG